MITKLKKLKILYVAILISSILFHPLNILASNIDVTPRKAIGFKWSTLPLVVSFQYDGTDITNNGNTNDEETAIRNAMALWNDVEDAEKMITFSLVNYSSNKIIYKDAGYSYIGKTDPSYQAGSNDTVIQGANILLNTNQYWTSQGAKWLKYDIQTIVGHELGHVLGVAHCHVSNDTLEGRSTAEDCFSATCQSNIMTPKIPTNTAIHTLTDYDESSYRLIYFDDIH